jgi:hypothetical protein
VVKANSHIIITNMSNQLNKYSIVILFVSAVCFFVSSINCLAITESISNPYQTATAIKPGSIVSLVSTKQNEIVAANTTNESKLIGVTVNNQQSLLAVNDASNTTQVISNGIADTLVSTMNGSISIGSQIAVSPLSGVGENAGSGSRVVGIAEAAFNSSTAGSVTQSIYDTNKHQHKIYVGYIPILIAVSSNTSTTDNGSFINSLHNLVNNLSGRTISNTSLLLICIIIVVAFIAIIVLIYGAITGGLISIGRNPLAKSSILSSLGQIFFMVLIIAVTSIIIIYFILH